MASEVFAKSIRKIAASGIFHSLRLSGSHRENRFLGDTHVPALLHLLWSARYLERLTLCDFELSKEAALTLLRHQSNAGLDTIRMDGPSELVLDGFQFEIEVSSSGEHQSAAIPFADAMTRLTSLRRLVLKCSYIDDHTLSCLFRKVGQHPALDTLSLSYADFGAETMVSMREILSTSNCRLLGLALMNHVAISNESSRRFNMRGFIDALPFAAPLISLSLSKQSLTDLDASLLLQNLFKLPNLQHLNLELNHIQDLSIVTNYLRMASTDCVRQLSSTFSGHCLTTVKLDYNECFRCVANTPRQSILDSLLLLVRFFPRLFDFGMDCRDLLRTSSGIPLELEYQMDLNLAGGFLLHEKESISPSLWPWVLARANDLPVLASRSRSARVIYAMLREGPALCGRDAEGQSEE